MTKKNEEATPQAPIAVDSDEREGNDVASLIGSGAPMVTIRANASILGLASGEKGTFVQTEEIRLIVQNGLASVVDE